MWELYCKQRGFDPIKTTVNQGIGFLQHIVSDPSTHRGYSAVCTARSALSSIILLPDGSKFGDHYNVKLFVKGIHNMDPPQVRYIDTWDPQQVLDTIKFWAPAHKISLKKLSMKLAMLVLLVSGQRGQILVAMRTDDMHISSNSFKFVIKNSDIKQGRIGYKPNLLELKKFPSDKRLCVYHYLAMYLKRTMDIRNGVKNIFLTTKKPHVAASRDTLSRWIKETLKLSGIDINIFKPGSTRAASTSKAMKAGATVEEIMKSGGWSRASTFTKWYHKPLKGTQRSLDQFVLK